MPDTGKDVQKISFENQGFSFRNSFLPSIFHPLAPSAKAAFLPLFASAVPAGFPSPADDYIEKKPSLDDFLLTHPEATFYVTVEGDSMIEAGIDGGDTLLVDRALEPKSGDIVIAEVEGEFTVKSFYRRGKVCELRPRNPKYKAIPFPQSDDDRIVGVVTWALKKCSR